MTSGFVFWVISMERILKKRYLFDFESLVDIKVGCVRYILNSKKLNTSYIKPCMLEPTLALLKQLSVGSVERNPVKWILKDEYSDSADDLYKELMTDHYDSVLNNAISTDIFKLVRYTKKASNFGVETVINCFSEKQKEMLKTVLTDKSDVVYVDSVNDLSSYNCLYISDIERLSMYLHIYGRTVYIHNTINIYDADGNLKPDVRKYNGKVVIKTVDPYIGIPLFIKSNEKSKEDKGDVQYEL